MVPQVPFNSECVIDFGREMASSDVHAAFGGGVGAFGSNFAVFHYNGFTIWVDSGAGFSNLSTPGLNKLLPDQKLLCSFKPDAIILTHAHEDHIGAIPYLLKIIPERTPVYASPFTIAAVRLKLEDISADPEHFEYHSINHNQTKKIGPAEASFFFMPHSIPQVFSVGLNYRKAKKKIYFTSDFKTQGTEERFNPEDIKKFGPVDYLFIDSTGAMQKGLAPSEETIVENFRNVLSSHNGRVIITTFSSHIERIRTLFKLADESGRAVSLQGYSIKNNLKAAFNSAEFDTPAHQLSGASPRNRRAMWLVAGCQAEEGSSFYRLVNDQLAKLKLKEDDLLIYSGSIIPGNEEPVFNALNTAAEKGVIIRGLPGDEQSFHVTGHGRREDIRQLISWVKPRVVVPVHGDPLHFRAFETLAAEAEASLDYARNGGIYALLKSLMQVSDENYSPIYVEYGEMHQDPALYSRRRKLSENGICNVTINGSFELLNLNYVGVASDGLIDKKIGELTKGVQSILNSSRDSGSSKIEKKIQEKISQLNLNILKKAPFINLVQL